MADQLGDQSLVAGGEAGGADHVDLLLDREPRAFLGRLEERAGDHLEAEIGEGRGDHVGAAVVAVLAHLGDEHAGLAAEPACRPRRRPSAPAPRPDRPRQAPP